MQKSVTVLSMCALLTSTGCGRMEKRVVFATKTQLGLDVSGTAQVPDKVSFTYGRFEGAIVPRSENGEPYSVYGGLDADVNFFGDQTIKQVFATGNAAVIAAGDSQARVSEADTCTCDKVEPISRKSLFFVTDTAYGLKLSAGKQDVSPTLMVGFKRIEGAIIPVHKNEPEVRSVFADLSINTKELTTGGDSGAISFPNNGGVRIIQGFATGRAAELRATNRDVQAALKKASSPEAAKVKQMFTERETSVDAILQHVTRNGKVDQAEFLKLAGGNRVMEKKIREATVSDNPEDVRKKVEEFEVEQIYSLKKRIPNR